MAVRVRFAPSPTGYLHIGGVRTALFNWLFARRHGGAFVLRVDDTDRDRNLEEALGPILDGFRWLGIDWDEGPEVGGPHEPYYQSQRGEHHRRAVETLLDEGLAYWDYATPEELEEERRRARDEKRRFVYSRRFRAADEEERRRFEADGRTGVVRLEMPREGECRFDDLVRGEVAVEWALEQDHVIQRADGSVLYHLASVVDDEAMGITHVIRAEEHLSNTPRQIFIAEGLGTTPPRWAHLPFVAEPGSHTKLSKRELDKYLKQDDFARLYERGRRIADELGLEVGPEAFNPVTVDFYRQVGFLSDALVNYLLLLGWSLDDRTEFLSRQEMIENFSLERVNRSPASLDPQRLEAFQAHYMRQLDEEEKVELCRRFVDRAGWAEGIGGDLEQRVRRIVRAAGDRIVVAGDILEYRELLDPSAELEYDDKAFEKRLRKPEEAAELLAGYRDELAEVEPFEAEALEASLRDYVERRGVKLGQVIHALRVAVTGKAVGFGMFETLEILGREACLERIDRALEMV
ncbi:MAG: glutamate--tRNA ligase [Thermoanaerobaculia bacterium]|nr:glutamate--tRNA ligase [Thermoanaerobaculia bacterium]